MCKFSLYTSHSFFLTQWEQKKEDISSTLSFQGMVRKPGRAKRLHTPYTPVNRTPKQAEETGWGLWGDRIPPWSCRITSIESSIAACITFKVSLVIMGQWGLVNVQNCASFLQIWSEIWTLFFSLMFMLNVINGWRGQSADDGLGVLWSQTVSNEIPLDDEHISSCWSHTWHLLILLGETGPWLSQQQPRFLSNMMEAVIRFLPDLPA